MNFIKSTEIATGVAFNYINDNRFKSSRISAYFVLPLTKENASVNTLLSQILCRSSQKFPDFKSLNTHLNLLYGANLSADTRKNGDNQVMSISISGLDDKYTIGDEKVSSELSMLICDLIFRPNIVDGKFNKLDFEQEKRQLVDLIDSDFNEKRIYALNRTIEEMCKDETFGILSYGTKENVINTKIDEIYKAWQHILKTAKIEIVMVGSSTPDEAIEIFKNAFKGIDREVQTATTKVIKEVEKVKYIEEKMDVTQSKLVMGFRSGISNIDEADVPALKLMVSILGGTAHSKFFLNVREKYSLCYYCASRVDVEKGIIIVDSGVENENIEKAKAEILNQIELLKSGELTDFEIDATKLSIVNSYTTTTDSVYGIEAWYSNQLLSGKMKSPEEASELINKVTKEDVIRVANKMQLDTVYLLTSK